MKTEVTSCWLKSLITYTYYILLVMILLELPAKLLLLEGKEATMAKNVVVEGNGYNH